MPIKGVIFVDYPLGGKQAYLEWVASISSALVAPSQLKATASYDNYYGESPHRLVELEFASQEDIDAYEELEGIMAIEAELDNQRWQLGAAYICVTFRLHQRIISHKCLFFGGALFERASLFCMSSCVPWTARISYRTPNYGVPQRGGTAPYPLSPEAVLISPRATDRLQQHEHSAQPLPQISLPPTQ